MNTAIHRRGRPGLATLVEKSLSHTSSARNRIRGNFSTSVARPGRPRRWIAVFMVNRILVLWRGALAANLPTRGLTLDALLVAINGGQEK
jgi:hypothetical protein